MTIFNKTVKVRDINPATYTPKRGIDVIYSYYNNEVYPTLTAGNINSPEYITDKSDINAELSKLKVIQDSIKTYKTYNKVRPKSPLRITHHDDGNKLIEDKA